MAKTTYSRGLTMVQVNITLAFHGGYENDAIDAVARRLELCANRLENCTQGTKKAVWEADLNRLDDGKGDD